MPLSGAGGAVPDVPPSGEGGRPGPRHVVSDSTEDQPDRRLGERHRRAAAEALAGALEPGNGWYADFVVGDERVVVFAAKVFRYRRGDAAGRAEAVAYGRSVGTPEQQLDWGE